MSSVTLATRRAETLSADDTNQDADLHEPEMEPTRDQPDKAGHRPVPAARAHTPALPPGVRQTPSVFNIEDNLRQKSEIKILRAQLRQIQNEYRNEQELVLQLKRRVNSSERARMEESAKINQEAVTLQTTAAKLRSQVEQTQADKQAGDFNLAKIKRDVINERRGMSEREQNLLQQADQLREQVKNQDRHVQELGHQIETIKQIMNSNQQKHDQAMEEKCKEMDVLKSELDYVMSERNRLETVVQEKEAQLDDVNEKVSDYEDQLRHQAEIIRKQMTELAMTKDREDTLCAELESSRDKLRHLESSVEAERAAHLESKFNSEIVQLRLKDVEGALETEKSTCNETSTNFDQLNKQYKDLLDQYHHLKVGSENSQEKYQALQNEYEKVRTGLMKEVDEKKSVIMSLSDQLALHQSNFEALKDELHQAKKKQGHLEDTYGSSMRELEMLLENFNFDKEGKPLDSKAKPYMVLENLRQTLMLYKKNLNMTCEELDKMKKHSENLGKECESYRDVIWTKDKALEETQKGYTQASKDLNRLRGQFVECEAQQAQMKAQLQAAVQERDRDRHNAEAMSEEIQRLSRKMQAEEEEHVNYLHSLYQRVVMGRSVTEPKTSVLSSYKWQDLSIMVSEQIAALMNSVHRSDDKLSHLEMSSRSKEEMIQQMQKAHDEQLDKLEALSIEREKAWQKQKTDLEEHYSKLLSEVHIRSKKSQSLADQAWERVRATGSVQQGLEGECLNLMNSLNQMKHEQGALVSACALLAGAFFPLYARYTCLATQHKLLDEQADQASSIYAQARLLVDTLHAELNNSGSKIGPDVSKPGLARFRVGVVAVIASNRLKKSNQGRAKMFTSYDLSAGLAGLPVWCGGVVKSVEKSPVKDDGNGQNGAFSWLTDDTLRQTVLAATADLQDVLTHAKKQGSAVDVKLLLGAARTSFAKLTDQLSQYYPNIDDMTSNRDKQSLVRQLGNGLQKMIVEGDRATKNYFAPPQQVMTKLQQYVLDLAKRLHESEVQRRALNQQLSQVDSESLKGDVNQLEQLSTQLHTLKTRADQMVEVSRFEQVCEELNEALQREQHAQKLLTKQAKQIEEVTVKLDGFMSEDKESRQNLSETIQNLSQAKLDLRHKEQQIRQLTKNLTQLESDNAELLNNIKDAELALRTTTRDRDTLCQYMKGVENSLDSAKRNLSVSSRLKPTQCMEDLMSLMPTDQGGKSGPETLACQRMVTKCVDVQQNLLSRLVTMESEIQMHKNHIHTLKEELASACERVSGPYGEGSYRDLPIRDFRGSRDFPGREELKPRQDGRDRDDFTPLQLDPDTPRSDEAAPVSKLKSKATKSKSSKSGKRH